MNDCHELNWRNKKFQCDGKRGYGSWQRAKRYAKASSLDAYYCPHCGLWHLGHSIEGKPDYQALSNRIRRWEEHCKKKYYYFTEREALIGIAKRKKGGVEYANRLYPYFCPRCGFWHVGGARNPVRIKTKQFSILVVEEEAFRQAKKKKVKRWTHRFDERNGKWFWVRMKRGK